jgi:hypothetical protein
VAREYVGFAPLSLGEDQVLWIISDPELPLIAPSLLKGHFLMLLQATSQLDAIFNENL